MGEHERQETAVKDAKHRAMDFRELQAAAAEDARERLDEISRRCSEVADMMDTFFRTRTAQAARDARDRVMAERDRRAEAMVEMHARVSELAEFSGMWGQHTVVMEALAPKRPRCQHPGPLSVRACKTAPACTGEAWRHGRPRSQRHGRPRSQSGAEGSCIG